MATETQKGILATDPEIDNYVLYSRGNAWIPERFYDHILIDKRKPYDHNKYIGNGFYLNDIKRVAARFGGIGFDLLGN